MSGEGWICRNPAMLDAFVAHIKSTWNWDKPLSIAWKAGVMRSNGQLALCHIWIRTITDYLNARTGGDYDEETMKTYLKREYGVRISRVNPINGKTEATLKSLGKYEKGELHEFMTRVDVYASGIGCIFPVWGEYEELKRAQTA